MRYVLCELQQAPMCYMWGRAQRSTTSTNYNNTCALCAMWTTTSTDVLYVGPRPTEHHKHEL